MKIGILGTGAYGIALAITAFKNKNDVTMWTKFENEYNSIKNSHRNEKALPDVTIPGEIKITMNLKEAIYDKEIIIIVTPSNSYEFITNELNKYVDSNQIICIASKGLYRNNFLSNIIEEKLNNDICVISGPSFAIDLINNNPIGISLGCKNDIVHKKISKVLGHNNLIISNSNDIIGIQICGAIKNALAIGSGILDGLNCLESTRASYLAVCINNIRNFLENNNCNPDTVLDYAGIGDLILTCNSLKSRNFKYGYLIGSKALKDEILNFKNNNLIEGIDALENIYNMAKSNNQNIYIIDLIYDIVFNDKNPELLLDFINEKKQV